MRFKSFKFSNFRGIESAFLDLARKPSGHINVLVGLNESGKTTILEGAHHFLSNPNLLKKMPSAVRRTNADYQAMLPIGKRALFNGTIEIAALVETEKEDWNKIDEYLKMQFGFAETIKVEEFEIAHRNIFEDSKHKSTTNIWDIQFAGRKPGRGQKFIRLEGDDWLKTASFVETLLPKIVYFPSTLIQFPDRIVLEDSDHEDADSRNDFYCGVIEDILRAVNPALKLATHVIARAKSNVKSDQENLEALLIQIGQHLKNTVFTEWKKIFNQSPQDKDFRVGLKHENNQLVLEVKILTPDGIFSINERSSGFRWFFAFILLTRYRLYRKDRVLFLFDEPAANLHPNAQTLLLKSFELLAQEADVIYSTHSHYLINPLWLESTHIVRNMGSNESGDMVDENPMNSSINVMPYRTFVGSHPDQYFYYKPIQEALDYAPSPLEFPSSVILVEGKTDFFALKFVSSLLESGSPFPAIFPGGGAGSLDPLISLLYGWGKNFVVLVDSDEAGIKQKARYLSKYEQIVEGRLFSLEDINAKWKGFRIEQILDAADIELVRKDRFPDEGKLNKKQLHIAIQELIILNRKLAFSNHSRRNFKLILDRLATELSTHELV